MALLHLSQVRAVLLVATALGSVFGTFAGVSRAHAQGFVCGGSADGSEPQTGLGATASGGGIQNNVACGGLANANGDNSANTAIGDGAVASGKGSVNTATGSAATALGDLSNNSAFGNQANANGNGNATLGAVTANVAIGLMANASSTTTGDNVSFNTAVGNLANASGDNSRNLALGVGANASGPNVNNTAIGANATATGANSIAVGSGANATFSGSAAFGIGATTTRAQQQMFGVTGNTYTMPGITSGASAAAQTGPLQIVTSDAGGNLATNTAAGLGLASSTQINSQISAINSQISTINSQISTISSQTQKAVNGVAMAFAMGATPWLLPTERFAVSMDWGTFQGTSGLALNAAMRLGPNMQATGGLAYGANGGGVGGRAGVRVGF